MPKVGSMIDVKFDNKANVATTYLAFYSGLSTYFSEIKNGQAMVPTNLTNSGQRCADAVGPRDPVLPVPRGGLAGHVLSDLYSTMAPAMSKIVHQLINTPFIPVLYLAKV
jgi:hypothetical protein